MHTIEADDYDSPWKEAVEQYFFEFIQFYFPTAHSQINWMQGFEFLEQELRAITQDAELGKRIVDKLAKITMLNGDDKFIYIHIEVQGNQQTNFAERIFIYNYRIYDKYRRPVASMVVLSDEDPDWRPNCFEFEVMGCRHSLKFPVAKLTDYQENLEKLLVSNNAFAIITAAHLLTQHTRKDSQARYVAKYRLVRLLYDKQWEKQRIIDLLWILDWLMHLPENLERQLHYEIAAIEEKEHMRYVTSWERFAREDGRQVGMLEGEAKLLKKQLERRFDVLPDWVAEKLNAANEQDLEQWGEAILNAASLSDIFNDSPAH